MYHILIKLSMVGNYKLAKSSYSKNVAASCWQAGYFEYVCTMLSESEDHFTKIMTGLELLTGHGDHGHRCP